MKQKTLAQEVTISGKGVHTGSTVNLVLGPAPENSGITFQRTDLYGKPKFRPCVTDVTDLVRSTTVANAGAEVHTVEHILSSLSGLGIDNALVQLDAAEPPILDGSAREFTHLIQQAQIVEQNETRKPFAITEPICISEGNRSIIALPYDGYKITCTSADDRGHYTQHLSLDIDPQSYVSEIAPARTFAFYEEIEPLLKMGKIQGASLETGIVIKGDQILSKEPLRYNDEFVRHKILDIVGDLSLLQRPIKAHIIAVRPGHALNAKLAKAIAEQIKRVEVDKPPSQPETPLSKERILPEETTLNIERILHFIPHRYPFVLIDRVTEIKNDEEIVAIKNVTINEPFFQGHFPGKPVMPGVLQLEAMAQAAGILMPRRMNSLDKLILFMSADKVKYRQAVVPGDQLEINVQITKTKEMRGQTICYANAFCTVDGKKVSSAELSFAIVDSDKAL